MKYRVGQVFKGENDELFITKADNGMYSVQRLGSTEYKVRHDFIDEFMEHRELIAVRPFAIGDRVFTKNRAVFEVLNYDCAEGYLRGRPETGSPQLLKISGLTKCDSASDAEIEEEDEMVSLNEVCDFLVSYGERFVADQVRGHFAEKKQKQDPEYQEYLRLKEKFDQ